MIKTILKIIASALIATGTIAIMINVGFIKIGEAAILDPEIIKLETENALLEAKVEAFEQATIAKIKTLDGSLPTKIEIYGVGTFTINELKECKK